MHDNLPDFFKNLLFWEFFGQNRALYLTPGEVIVYGGSSAGAGPPCDYLYCLRRDTGEEIWALDYNHPSREALGHLLSPFARKGDTLWISSAPPSFDSAAEAPLLALDARTGEILRRYALPVRALMPFFLEETLCVMDHEGRVSALSPEEDAFLFRAKYGEEESLPQVDGDTLWVKSIRGRLWAIEKDNLRERWQKDFQTYRNLCLNFWGALVLIHFACKSLYTFYERKPISYVPMMALSRRDGARVWETESPVLDAVVPQSPAATHLFALSPEGDLLLVELDTGRARTVGRFSLRKEFLRETRLCRDGLLVSLVSGGRVWVRDALSGAPLWEWELPYRSHLPLASADGQLFYLAEGEREDRLLCCFSLPQGRLLWAGRVGDYCKT